MSKCKFISNLLLVASIICGSSAYANVITLYTPPSSIGTGVGSDPDAPRGLVECSVLNVSNHPIDIKITIYNIDGTILSKDSDFGTYLPGVIPGSARVHPLTRIVYCEIKVRGVEQKVYKHQVRGSLTWFDVIGTPGSEMNIPYVVIEAH